MNICEVAGIKNVNNPNAFIVCSNAMDDVYQDIDNNNPKIDIMIDDMIADIMKYKPKISGYNQRIVYQMPKMKFSLVFITQSYFYVPKDVRLNSTHYLIMKINNKRELQNIAINHSADIDYQDFMKIMGNVRENHIFF